MPGIETETATPQPASALTALVAEIRQTDRAFDLQDFLDNALAAYEAVVVAFATGDRETLKMLLSDEVYAAFATAMSEREARGETTETVFSRLDTPVLSDSFLAEGQTMFSIRLGGELFSTTGGTTKQAKLCDEWVFARPQGSHDPVWLIVATRAAPPATTTTQERHA